MVNQNAGPTPYLDNKCRRINMSENGAMFTMKSNGNRNYSPIANMIKNGPNGKKIPITNKNKNTVPIKIRPKNMN